MKRGQHLEYATLGYNALEAVIAIASGMVASSIALIGFGIDSVIEVSAGSIMLWRLSQDADPCAERKAQRWIGYSFFALAAYVLWEAVGGLWRHEAPEASWIGIALASVSVILMPLLAARKRQVGLSLGSAAMIADARQTALCSYLSAILLLGLAANALAGWWWADAVAGLVMTPIICKEGIDALRGEGCQCH